MTRIIVGKNRSGLEDGVEGIVGIMYFRLLFAVSVNFLFLCSAPSSGTFYLLLSTTLFIGDLHPGRKPLIVGVLHLLFIRRFAHSTHISRVSSYSMRAMCDVDNDKHASRHK